MKDREKKRNRTKSFFKAAHAHVFIQFSYAVFALATLL